MSYFLEYSYCLWGLKLLLDFINQINASTSNQMSSISSSVSFFRLLRPLHLQFRQQPRNVCLWQLLWQRILLLCTASTDVRVRTRAKGLKTLTLLPIIHTLWQKHLNEYVQQSSLNSEFLLLVVSGEVQLLNHCMILNGTNDSF